MSLAHLFFKDIEMPFNNSLLMNSVIGISSGALGIILMLYSVKAGTNIIIDFRYIPVLLTSIYIGWLPAIIASLIIGGFRILYFGVSEPAVIATVNVLLVGAGFSIISKLKTSRRRKYIYSMGYMFVTTSVAFFIALEFSMLFLKISGIFCIANTAAAWVAFRYAEYLGEFIKLHQNLKNDAAKDFLTGLNNVRQFDTSFKEVSRLTLKKGKKLSLLFIDIDYFKNINDTYGHNAGDAILKGVAEILVDMFRVFDVVSRNGGEEFSVLLMDCASHQALVIAERLRKKVENHEFEISDKEILRITISVGVSTYPDTTQTIGKLLEDADSALYEAKRTGRGKVVIFGNDDIIEEMDS